MKYLLISLAVCASLFACASEVAENLGGIDDDGCTRVKCREAGGSGGAAGTGGSAGELTTYV